MSARDRVRFCNNPGCERLDEHLRAEQLLRKGGRDLCPACHEPVVARDAWPRAPRLPLPPRPEARRI